MATLAIIGMAVFAVLLLGMSLTAGTQSSISQLAGRWRWLLTACLCSQALLLPPMLAVTPDCWQWLAFIGISMVVVCGITNVLDKADERMHMVAAVIGFTALTGWVMAVDSVCLLPLIMCVACGRERWKWRIEVGLVISVYMALVHKMGI